MTFIKFRYNKENTFYYKNEPSEALLEIVVSCFNNNPNSFKLIKEGKERKIFKFSLEDKNYYLKQYNYKNVKKIIKNNFRRSPAYRSFKITHDLLNNNISVVHPILAAVNKQSFYKQKSIFVTKDFGGLNLQNFIAYENYTKEIKYFVLKKTAKIWAKLYNNNFFNDDPNLASILINFDRKVNKIALVDVDDIKHSMFLTKKKILDNLVDLNAHSYSGLGKISKKRLNHEDRLFFLNELIKSYNDIAFNKLEAEDYIMKNTYNLLDEWDKLDCLKN